MAKAEHQSLGVMLWHGPRVVIAHDGCMRIWMTESISKPFYTKDSHI